MGPPLDLRILDGVRHIRDPDSQQLWVHGLEWNRGQMALRLERAWQTVFGPEYHAPQEYVRQDKGFHCVVQQTILRFWGMCPLALVDNQGVPLACKADGPRLSLRGLWDIPPPRILAQTKSIAEQLGQAGELELITHTEDEVLHSPYWFSLRLPQQPTPKTKLLKPEVIRLRVRAELLGTLWNQWQPRLDPQRTPFDRLATEGKFLPLSGLNQHVDFRWNTLLDQLLVARERRRVQTLRAEGLVVAALLRASG